MSVWPVIAEGTYAEDLHLAWHRSQLPFDHLDDAGALPDSVAHSEVLHNFAKPPIHGWAFGHLRRLLPRALTLDELEQAYQRLARWTVFWLDHRRVPGHDLPHYQHGNDSGWDNATTFDGERLLETADLAAFLTLQLCELARPAGELGDDAAARWDRTAVSIRAALMASLRDGSRFGARSATTGRCGSSSSLLGLMPVTLGPELSGRVLERLADGLKAHLIPHGLATEPLGSPPFRADGYLVLGTAYEARRQPGGREPGDRQPCPAREELRKGLSECLHHRRRCEGASPLSGAVSALVRTKTVCPVRGRRGNGP